MVVGAVGERVGALLELESATAATDRASELLRQEEHGTKCEMALGVTDTAVDSGGGGGGVRPAIVSARHSPVVYGTALAQGLRPQMEDGCVVAPLLEGQYLLAACLDGHNGAQVGGRGHACFGPACSQCEGIQAPEFVCGCVYEDSASWVLDVRRL